MFDHPGSGRETAVDGLFIFRIEEDSNPTLTLKRKPFFELEQFCIAESAEGYYKQLVYLESVL